MLGLIAAFKLVKAALFIAGGVGVLRMLNPAVEERVRQWLLALSLAHGWPIILRLLSKMSGLSGHRLQALGAVAFAYAALFLVEGIGLWLAQRWAEYLTVVATASFLPIEIYELHRGMSPVKFVALLANIAMVGYLIYRLWHDRRTR